MDDAETKQILSEADQVKSMLESDGWKLVKSKLDARILDLQNINNLDLTKLESVNTQIAARKTAVDEIFGWLKGDVYGFVEQQEKNNQSLMERAEQFIDVSPAQ